MGQWHSKYRREGKGRKGKKEEGELTYGGMLPEMMRLPEAFQ